MLSVNTLWGFSVADNFFLINELVPHFLTAVLLVLFLKVEGWIWIWFDHLKAILKLYYSFVFDIDSSVLLLRPWLKCKNMHIQFDGQPQCRCLSVLSFTFLCLDMTRQLRPALYRKVCFYSTYWSRGKEGQNRLLRAKLNLCRAAGSHEIKPLTLSAVFIIRWPFLCVLCCDFDVLSHNRGATILWRGCQ